MTQKESETWLRTEGKPVDVGEPVTQKPREFSPDPVSAVATREFSLSCEGQGAPRPGSREKATDKNSPRDPFLCLHCVKVNKTSAGNGRGCQRFVLLFLTKLAQGVPKTYSAYVGMRDWVSSGEGVLLIAYMEANFLPLASHPVSALCPAPRVFQDHHDRRVHDGPAQVPLGRAELHLGNRKLCVSLFLFSVRFVF